jgi:hypothetical protein
VTVTTSSADMASRSHNGSDLHTRNAIGVGPPGLQLHAGSSSPVNSPAAAQTGSDHHGAPIRKVIPPTMTPPTAPTELAAKSLGEIHRLVIAAVRTPELLFILAY